MGYRAWQALGHQVRRGEKICQAEGGGPRLMNRPEQQPRRGGGRPQSMLPRLYRRRSFHHPVWSPNGPARCRGGGLHEHLGDEQGAARGHHSDSHVPKRRVDKVSRWVAEATKAAWRRGSEAPLPTFSPSLRQSPVMPADIRECHIRRSAAMVAAHRRALPVRLGRIWRTGRPRPARRPLMSATNAASACPASRGHATLRRVDTAGDRAGRASAQSALNGHATAMMSTTTPGTDVLHRSRPCIVVVDAGRR